MLNISIKQALKSKNQNLNIYMLILYIYIFYKNMIEKFLINLFKIVNVSVFRTGLDDFIFEEQYKVEFKKFKTSTSTRIFLY